MSMLVIRPSILLFYFLVNFFSGVSFVSLRQNVKKVYENLIKSFEREEHASFHKFARRERKVGHRDDDDEKLGRSEI